MVQLVTFKKLSVGLVVVGFSLVFDLQNTFAAENGVLDQPVKYSVTNSAIIKQSIGAPSNHEMLDLLIRIESLERQVLSMGKRLDRNIMSGASLRETRELASDAWTLAVEARAIAVRAEGKADQAQKR